MILPVHQELRSRVRDALVKLYGLAPDQLPDIVVQSPPRRAMGDLGITVAFELARTLRKAPKTIAAELIDALGSIDGISDVVAAPNGYVNIFLRRAAFTRRLFSPDPGADRASVVSTPTRGKAIVEHTAINPNKAAHIGHLRNAALGDTLARVLRFLDLPVEVQNYIDDTGVQVADVVVGFEQLERMSCDDVAALADQPRFDHYCWDLYAAVTRWYHEDETRLEHRTRTLHDLEHGSDPSAALGALIADRIVRCHLATLARMNIEYDLLTRESDILHLRFWARAFEVLQKAGAIHLAESGPQAGCWVMPIEDGAEAGERSGPKSSTKVIVRSNSTVTYVGKDIAYQFWKFGLLGCDFRYAPHSIQRSGHPLWTTTSNASGAAGGARQPEIRFGSASSVYNVIDTRQSYLQQLLAQALDAAGRPQEAARSTHVSYEMVALSRQTAEALGFAIGADANQRVVEVSGRKGLGVKADDLLDRLADAARSEVAARHDDLAQDPAETNRIAGIIACAAIRYFMIKYSRGKLIAFDIDEALSFEGESGPYLQYAAVRATNILRKLADAEGTDEKALVAALNDLSDTPLTTDPESETWSLILEASRLDEVADQSIRSLELSVLAKYAFNLAQQFNAFYHRAPVVAESDRATRLWRAAAVLHVRNQLTRALSLMGCEVPPRM
ncbi:MAG: arginine--tRNA ligase [Acidobacteria bacterium]|nr:arginine--tRNA ligase [Acidobacteriota bacterium]MYJ03587.1 arginine--tRNA ligase [Acidobacteriota bacterium]